MSIKESLIKATEEFNVIRALNEAEPMDPSDIARALGTTKQNIGQALRLGMGKLYKTLKKDYKANPAQAMKILIEFFNADAEDVLSYLSPDAKTEVENYVRQHGAK
jgi:hypothetical protein